MRQVDFTAKIDVMALSTDGKAILAGECKWSEKGSSIDMSAIDRRLRKRVDDMPLAAGKRVVTACRLGGGARGAGAMDHVLGPNEVLGKS